MHKPRWYSCPRILTLIFSFLAVSAMAQTAPPELFNGLKWRLIGPFRGGRGVAVAGVPGDSTTFYSGYVNGGVWKTTDAGVVWTPIFDGQTVASIGALAVAPSDPKTIYAGTGESDIRASLSFGTGVYKSVDAGKTWLHVGLEDTRHISRIVVDPRDANVVYLGALGHVYGPNDQRGVFKSVDGGIHWARVLDLGPEIGVSDLTICASNPQILLAGTWQTKRPPWSTYAPINGPGGGLYRSLDSGQTWSRLTGKGLPEGDWGRVGVEIAPDGKRVYALIQAKQAGLYRSDDGGDTWALANADPRLTGRAWYFSRVTIDPGNRDVIYVPNVALYRSEDGGKTISVVRGAPGGDDYHQLWIDPKNSSSMVLGTDQGTTVSVDRGKTWSSWYNQPTAQIYQVTTDNQFPYVVYGTQQDSGSMAVRSRSDSGQITPRDWFSVGPSESGYTAVDPNDPNLIYQGAAYGGVGRFNRRTGLSQDVTPWPVQTFGSEIREHKYRAPWSPVLLFSPVDPKALYLGTQYAMKTVDGGLHWETLSPDLTGASLKAGDKPEGPPTVQNAKQRGYGTITTLAPSALNRDLIWAGSDTGLIHLTRDGGKTWNNVTPPGLSDWSKISSIEASHFDPAVAYAAVDRSRIEDLTPYIFRTRDYGASWQRVNDGISAPAFSRAVREDPKAKGLLFAGTEFGINVSFDDGDHWQPLQLNLPVSSVRDLTIHGDDLVAATHGRSFWILDDITPLRQVADARKATAAWLYRPGAAVRVDSDGFVGTPLPPEEPTAENPPNGAVIDYYLKSPASKVVLEVFDRHRNLVRSFFSDVAKNQQATARHASLPIAERWFPKPFVVEKTAGMHRFVWDLMWGAVGSSSVDADPDAQNLSGPKAIPGDYEVRLTVDGLAHDQPLQVLMDPRSPATAETLAQQLELGQQIFAEALEARRAITEIGAVEKQLADALQKLGEQNSGLQAELKKAQAQVGQILVNDENASNRLGLENAYNNLASALQVVESGDRAVPSQAVEVYKESSLTAKARREEWASFKRTRLPPINQQLGDAKMGRVGF